MTGRAMHLTVLVGSLRAASFNRALADVAIEALPPHWSGDIASHRAIPPFDEDAEALPLPDAVVAFRDAIARADALLVATPEYNGGMPGAMKNAIDWASRPRSDIPRLFGGKPVALIGASTGAGGTMLAQDQWLRLFRVLNLLPWHGAQFMLPNAHNAFADGRLVDATAATRLRDYVLGFTAFADRVR